MMRTRHSAASVQSATTSRGTASRVPSMFQRVARAPALLLIGRTLLSRSHPRPPLKAPEAWASLDLAFPVKQNVMREQAKYKCLKFAALQRLTPARESSILDAR